MISQATQAPYGRGEQTILDTNVRRLWQLEPSQFRLENPEWEALPDVKAMHRWLGQVSAARAAADRLLAHCIAELRAATKEPIQPPQDWAREAELECRCEDCKARARFLRDPAARIGRFPLRKDRRQHLHQQIDAHRCDCTHVTERRGSPQKLVCTKTQAFYERRLKQYETDCQLLSELNALASGSQTTPHLSLAKRRTKGRSGVR